MSPSLYFRVTGEKAFVEPPLPVVTAVFFIVGTLMILLGILAEILMRTYFESQGKTPYTIRRTVNL